MSQKSTRSHISVHACVTRPLTLAVHLLVWTSCIVNQGWVAKVPANLDVKKKILRKKLRVPCINKKERKKKTDVYWYAYFFLLAHCIFCVDLFLENTRSVHRPRVSLHPCVMALSVNDSQWCLSGISNVSKRVTLDGSGFLTAFLGFEEQLSLYISDF